MISSDFFIDFVKAQVGKQYWNGTFGQFGTKSLYEQNKKRLPKEYEWPYEDKMAKTNCFDCHGIIKSAFWTKNGDKNHPEQYTYQKDMPDCDIPTAYNRCTSKGTMATMPECPGIYLFTKTKGHIAVYIGNGELVEARGHAYGVQRNKLKDRTCFTHWGKDTKMISFGPAPKPTPSDVDYDAKRKAFQQWLNTTYGCNLTIDGHCGKATMASAVEGLQRELNRLGECLVIDGGFGKNTAAALDRQMMKKGRQGNMICILQGLLYNAECDCKGFDASFGEGCEAAVKAYQKAHSLEVDGKVGAQTFSKLLGK